MLRPVILFAAAAVASLCGFASADQNIERWRALAARNGGVLKLDAQTHDAILREPREYSVSVLMTAMSPQLKCTPCQYVPCCCYAVRDVAVPWC